MKRGFMDLAVEIVKEYPGLTALSIVREALDCSSNLSDAQDPEQSLASTLNKGVQTGQEQRVWRKKISGVYRYFPASMAPTSDSNEEIIVQLSLSTQEMEDIDNLVAVGKFNNRSDVIKWLVVEGITANRAYLDKVADARNQIELLKREVVGA